MHRALILSFLAAALGLAACTTGAPVAPNAAAHAPIVHEATDTEPALDDGFVPYVGDVTPAAARKPTAAAPAAIDRAALPVRRLEQAAAFRQVSWMMTSASNADVEYRVQDRMGEWSGWQPAEISFVEGRAYNARILLDAPAHAVEVRGGDADRVPYFSLVPQITARVPYLTREDFDGRDDGRDDVPRTGAAKNPTADFVVSRQAWGALAPELECGDAKAPHRVSFHHTAIPADDGEGAAARVRQIQAFHINERGWCDIGYHYLVAQSGEVFQGRARIDRSGAHVGGHNSGNVGIAFIGDFTATAPTGAQREAAAHVLDWLHGTFGVSLDRRAVRGHHEYPGQTTVCPGPRMLGDGVDVIAQVVERARELRRDGPALVRR